jgi:SAM-dependent methyltransferase
VTSPPIKTRASGFLERLYNEGVAEYRAAILDALPTDPAAELLDVGCDDGEWTSRLAERMGIPPGNVSGMEIVDERRDLAISRGFDVVPGDIEQRWPFPDQRFDVVHANQVIEHVKRLDHFVSEAFRALRPGGRLVVCTENLASWPNVAALAAGFMPFSLANISAKGAVGNPFSIHRQPYSVADSWQHIHVVTLGALREIVAGHGFEVERVFGGGYFPVKGRVSRWLSEKHTRRTHFIGLVGRRPPHDDR